MREGRDSVWLACEPQGTASSPSIWKMRRLLQAWGRGQNWQETRGGGLLALPWANRYQSFRISKIYLTCNLWMTFSLTAEWKKISGKCMLIIIISHLKPVTLIPRTHDLAFWSQCELASQHHAPNQTWEWQPRWDVREDLTPVTNTSKDLAFFLAENSAAGIRAQLGESRHTFRCRGRELVHGLFLLSSNHNSRDQWQANKEIKCHHPRKGEGRRRPAPISRKF